MTFDEFKELLKRNPYNPNSIEKKGLKLSREFKDMDFFSEEAINKFSLMIDFLKEHKKHFDQSRYIFIRSIQVDIDAYEEAAMIWHTRQKPFFFFLSFLSSTKKYKRALEKHEFCKRYQIIISTSHLIQK